MITCFPSSSSVLLEVEESLNEGTGRARGHEGVEVALGDDVGNVKEGADNGKELVVRRRAAARVNHGQDALSRVLQLGIVLVGTAASLKLRSKRLDLHGL